MRELRYWMSTMRVAESVGRIYMGVATGLRDAVDAKVVDGEARIVIARRISEHVRAHNWFAVAIDLSS